MRIGSLFSGAGGLDLAVEQVFGGQTVWHSELEFIEDKDGRRRPNAAVKVLAHHWPGVPNLGDISAVDWATVEPIDILCGGFPCQDISAAGNRAGMGAGTRSGLWSEFARAIDELRPRVVVIENVRNLLSVEANRAMESTGATLGDGPGRPILRALGAVLGDLSDIGYDAQWATVAAADVGSCHERKRVFILATDTASDGRPRVDDSTSGAGPCGGREWLSGGSTGRPPGPVTLLPTPRTTDSFGAGAHGEGGLDLRTAIALLPTPGASDGSGGRSPSTSGGARPSGAKRSIPLTDIPRLLPAAEVATTQWGKYEPAIRSWESHTRPAPSPTEPNSKGNPRLAAPFSEWMMGWPAGWVTDLSGISRNDQLRIIGNGVVPQCAEAALRQLLAMSTVPA